MSKVNVLPFNAIDIGDDESGVKRHSYFLRPDLKVFFWLPTNLTEDEAKRLGKAIATLAG